MDALRDYTSQDSPWECNFMYEKPAVLAIHPAAIRHNLSEIRTRTEKRIIAVIKENGYGLGLENAYTLLRRCGIDFFAVATPQEALALRRLGWQGEILLMTPVLELSTCISLLSASILLALACPQQMVVLHRAAQICGKPPRVHLKIDSGFGRYGFSLPELLQFQEEIRRFPVAGCFTHFSVSGGPKLKGQLHRFLQGVEIVFPQIENRPMLHGASSSVLAASGDLGLDAVRIGSLLLGRSRFPLGLWPAATCTTSIYLERQLPPGSAIGYGAVVRCRKNTRIGIVPIGTGDGLFLRPQIFRTGFFPRLRGAMGQLLGNSGQSYAYSGGVRLPVLCGGVGHTILDLTGTAVQAGDPVRFDANPLLVRPCLPRQILEEEGTLE